MRTVSSYLEHRHLPLSVEDEWYLRIGWNERWPRLDGRLVIPILSYTKRIIGFAGRALTEDQQPKYLNTTFDKHLWLYGLWRERVSIPVLVEGYLDVWALALIGYNGYAVMGSGLSDWQAMHIAGMGDKAIVYPHADTDGKAWAEKLQSYGVQVEIPKTPYPLGAPRKEDGYDETADPHWLYVNEPYWLEMNLTHCADKMTKPKLEDFFK